MWNRGAGEAWLIAPVVVFNLAFFVAPLLLLVGLSFTSDGGLGLEQYRRILDRPVYLEVLADTLLLSTKVVLVATVFGYPIGLLYTVLGRRGRLVLLVLTILPLLTSNVVRALSWIVILGREGLINDALTGLGIVPEPMRLMYTETGLVLALAQIDLPLIVLPLIVVLSKIDRSLWEASTTLGMGAWRTFFRVVLPLSTPGLVAGWMLVFASSSMNFVTQAIIGGARLIYMPQFIYQEITTLYNWPLGAAVSVVMLLAIGGVLGALAILARNRRINVHA